MDQMRRTFFTVSLVVLLLSFVSVTPAPAQQSHDACARDVARLCRAYMSADDMTVLACLKQHRSRLSRACDKVLTDNGQ